MDECEIDLQEALTVAVTAAKRAGEIMMQHFQQHLAAVAAAQAPMALPGTAAPQTAPPPPPVPVPPPPPPPLLSSSATASRSGNAAPAAADPIAPSPPTTTAAAAAAAAPLLSASAPAGDAASELKIEVKTSSLDLVTQYDKLCDATITRILKQYTAAVERAKPHLHFTFITEECNPDVPVGEDFTWIVDPIDGTMSFVHGLPDCCVSIGLAWRKQPILAVVYCPFVYSGPYVTHFVKTHPLEMDGGGAHGTHNGGSEASRRSLSGAAAQGHNSISISHSTATTANERVEDRAESLKASYGDLYTAIKGRGAFLNGARLWANASATPTTAVAVFNFPFCVSLSGDELASAEHETIRRTRYEHAVDAALRIRAKMYTLPMRAVKLQCSGVMSIAQVAAGRTDLYVEPSCKVWDICAAALLVMEAGGYVCHLMGHPFDLTHDTTIIAAANEELAHLAVKWCVEESYGSYWRIPAV